MSIVSKSYSKNVIKGITDDILQAEDVIPQMVKADQYVPVMTISGTPVYNQGFYFLSSKSKMPIPATKCSCGISVTINRKTKTVSSKFYLDFKNEDNSVSISSDSLDVTDTLFSALKGLGISDDDATFEADELTSLSAVQEKLTQFVAQVESKVLALIF